MKQQAFERIYAIVAKIPQGKVMTYKQVSILANVATPRIVGFAMAANKDTVHVPCHRVIKSDGTLAGYGFGGTEVKRKMLEKEGITFTKEGKIVLEKHAL
jgi:methylated-DNA-protein-cysteine methyltransferase related protein